MGLTHKPLLVKESRRAKQSKEIKFLIDSGATTLESLGLVLNPLNRELYPMRMMLARTDFAG